MARIGGTRCPDYRYSQRGIFKDEKEHKLQEATLLIQSQYGKNALLKGFNFQEGGTTIARNEQIGGHRAGAGDKTIQPVKTNAASNTETKATNQHNKSETMTPSLMITKSSTRKGANPRIIYADIIDMPHHQSSTHAHMSLHDRDAQFNPFAALSGYDEMISDEIKTFEAQTSI